MQAKSTLWLIGMTLVFAGCMPVKIDRLEGIHHIRKDGSVAFEFRFLSVTPIEKTPKQLQEYDEFIAELAAGKIRVMDDIAAVEQLKQKVMKTGERQHDVIVTGTVPYIDDLFEIFVNNDARDLRKGRTRRLVWENNRLTVHVDFPVGKTDTDLTESEFVYIFRTDGLFASGTTGTLSKDRKETRIVISDHLPAITLVIDGLGVTKP